MYVSAVACSVGLGRLDLFCDRVGITPQELAEVRRNDPMKVENSAGPRIVIEEKKYARGYQSNDDRRKVLEYNHIKIRRKIPKS